MKLFPPCRCYYGLCNVAAFQIASHLIDWGPRSPGPGSSGWCRGSASSIPLWRSTRLLRLLNRCKDRAVQTIFSTVVLRIPEYCSSHQSSSIDSHPSPLAGVVSTPPSSSSSSSSLSSLTLISLSFFISPCGRFAFSANACLTAALVEVSQT